MCRSGASGPAPERRSGSGEDASTRGPADSAARRSGTASSSSARSIALNAVGDIDDGSEPSWPPPLPEGVFGAAGENTTIGVVATNAKLDKVGCLLVAQGGHDGLARALMPSHARGDGDAIVAAATGGVDAVVDHVRFLAVRAAERAIRSVAPAGHP